MDPPALRPHHVAQHVAHTDDSTLRLKRTIYLAYLGLVLVGATLLWLFPPGGSDSSARVVATVAVPPALLLAAFCIVLLWRIPASVTIVERALYWSSYPILIGVLVLTFTNAEDAVGRQAALHSFTTWVPIVVVWSFVAFGSRNGLVAAFGFVATAAAAVVAVELAIPHAETTGHAFALQAAVATTLFIFVLFAFTQLLERQVAARASAEVLATFAFRDALTGLPNRMALETRFEQARAIVRRSGGLLAVLFVDLDDFKRVNDTFGHRGGDALLRQFATRLLGSVRESDTVARVGGDEFVVLAFVRDDAQARVLVDKLRETQTAPYVLGDAEVSLGSSIGMSLYPRDGVDAEVLLERADVEMYEAKGKGSAIRRATTPAKPPRT